VLVLEDVGLLTCEAAVVHRKAGALDVGTGALQLQHTWFKVGAGCILAAICSVILRRDISVTVIY